MSTIRVKNQASAPGTPSTGETRVYVDTANKKLASKDDAGVVTNYGQGAAVGSTTPQQIDVGDTGAAGSSSEAARADHEHALPVPSAPADVTKAAASAGSASTVARADHKHDIATAAAVAVGTVNAEGGASTVARSDHTHEVTGLKIASEAQGDIIYRNASAWVRLAPGTSGQVLQTNGAGANPSWVTPTSGGATHMGSFNANNAVFPTSTFAGADVRNGHPVLAYDDTLNETVTFHGVVPKDYVPGTSLTVRIDWMGATATSGNVVWGVEFERIAPGGHDLDANDFAAQKTATTATAGTSGVIARTSISFSNAEADAIAAGDGYRLRLQRLGSNASDTMTGDAHVARVSLVQ